METFDFETSALDGVSGLEDAPEQVQRVLEELQEQDIDVRVEALDDELIVRIPQQQPGGEVRYSTFQLPNEEELSLTGADGEEVELGIEEVIHARALKPNGNDADIVQIALDLREEVEEE